MFSFQGAFWVSLSRNSMKSHFHGTSVNSLTVNCQLSTLLLVESTGIEPVTSCLQGRRSPSWANPPFRECIIDNWELKIKRLTEAPSNWCFIESLETQNAPWKLNIESIMMQLWEQQLREIFYNWVIIQFCKYLLLMSLHNSTNNENQYWTFLC